MVPVVLFTGFLGAGKTTVLLNLLRETADQGRRIAVLVNEFGAVDIDGAVLRSSQLAEMAAMSGGCACCAGQDDFLQNLISLSTRAREQRPELIIVESSGLADPLAMLDSVTAPGRNPYFEIRHIVTVVDGAAWNAAASAAGPLLRRQVALADSVVLNKADLADTSHITAVPRKIAELNPRAHVQWCAEGKADFKAVWNAVEQGTAREMAVGSAGAGVVHPSAHSLFIPVPHPVERMALQEALLQVPKTVWRGKGFVRLKGEAGLWLVQLTAEDNEPFVHFAPFHLPFGMDEPQLGLVFIGAQLESGALMEQVGGYRVLGVL